MHPVMIAMERLGYLPSNFKGQGGLKRQAMLIELNVSCDVIKPKNGSLIYFEVDLGQSKSKEIHAYLKEDLTGLHTFTLPPGIESLVLSCRAKVNSFKSWFESFGGEVEVLSCRRTDGRQYIMHTIRNMIDKRRIPDPMNKVLSQTFQISPNQIICELALIF